MSVVPGRLRSYHRAWLGSDLVADLIAGLATVEAANVFTVNGISGL